MHCVAIFLGVLMGKLLANYVIDSLIEKRKDKESE